jgi:3-methyladenine DNA glycosylase AlkD
VPRVIVGATICWIVAGQFLKKLAVSKVLWERRIAIVSTQYLIRKNQHADTLLLCKMLLKDSEDLMHKAVGWMLREVGKRDRAALVEFLDRYCLEMPRTALRYAIEHFSVAERARFKLLGIGPGPKTSLFALLLWKLFPGTY